MHLRSSIVTALLVAAVAPASHASWNRRILEVAVVPTTSAGKFDVHVVWTVDLGPNGTAINVGTTAELFVGSGPPVAVDTTQVKVDPGSGICSVGSCSGGCGTGFIDGITAAAFLCIDADGDGDCECSMPPITSTFPGILLPSGAQLVAKLTPAAGALGEPDPSDDQKAFDFTGPRLWTREIKSAKLIPAGGTGGGFNVEIAGVFGWTGLEGSVNLAAGGSAAGDPVDGADLAWIRGGRFFAEDPLACGVAGCGGVCGSWNGTDLECFGGNPVVACLCGGEWLYLWSPEQPVGPGDKITFAFVALPGALPILPGLGGSEPWTVVLQTDCVGDLNGDGVVDGADLGKILSNWGGPGVGDLNGDGTVAGADLGLVLSNWGPCSLQ